jgi:hypothetical protein
MVCATEGKNSVLFSKTTGKISSFGNAIANMKHKTIKSLNFHLQLLSHTIGLT